MTKINCAVIQDILPLYVDDIVSDETRELVEEHLKHCERCHQEVRMMTQDLTIPIEKEAPLIQSLKKKWRNKKLIIASLSILLTALVIFGGNYFIFHYDNFIPYSKSLVQIEELDDGNLVSHYYGESYYSINQMAPVTVTIDGNEKKAIFFYYTKTISDNPTRNLFGGNVPRHEQKFLSHLDSINNVDLVYYVEFDARKVFDQGGNWKEVADRAELIWEK